MKFQGPVGLGHNVRDSFPRFPTLTPPGYDAPEGGTADHLLNDTIEWNNSQSVSGKRRFVAGMKGFVVICKGHRQPPEDSSRANASVRSHTEE